MAEKQVIDVMNDPKAFHETINNKLRKYQQSEAYIELQKLRSKLLELEETNKTLEVKINGVTESMPIPDSKLIELELKYRQLESEKTDLENRLTVTNREQIEQIDKLSDNVRRLSTQNTDIECHVRSLRTKVPQLEDLNRRQESVIEAMKYKYNDTTFEKIKEMEKNMLGLEDNNKHLEHQIEALTKKQNEMTEESEVKLKQTFEHKMELETRATKLKSKVKELERVNNDLLGRLEEMKLKTVENAENDKEKDSKVLGEFDVLNAKIQNLNEEKIAKDAENNNLKKEIKKLKVKLVTYEKDL